HLPLILKPTGKGKLSKRDGDKLGFPVFPLEYTSPEGDVSRGYKEDGYFAEAVVNFLAFLGWNPGTEQEIFNLEELIEAFDLSKVNKAGARFDPDKIKWFNHHYMQEQSNDDLAEAFKQSHDSLKDMDVNYIAMVVGLIKERATFVNDFWGLSNFLFVAPTEYDEKAFKKAIKDDTKSIMTEVKSIINNIENFEVETIQNDVKGWITSKDIGFGKVMMPLRLALVGALQGPDVFDIMYMIGKNETIKRIDNLIEKID
ncbi:MAG: glutamate--tRNA ligase, partial [Flavobacteriaceae bacterium]|nr:glutamate--tRNA ligase [Flavobacteriaceae bacterium]